jgi:PPOX class probable F420-dependent enzyme
MTEMSKKDVRRFLSKGTLTGKLATVNSDGSSHVVPIWFILDEHESQKYDLVLTTSSMSKKARNIKHNNRISICVDDQTPPFSFVTIQGIAKIQHNKQKELLKWATKIAERYMGKSNAKAYGRRNSGDGDVLVRLTPTKIIAGKNIASWN